MGSGGSLGNIPSNINIDPVALEKAKNQTPSIKELEKRAAEEALARTTQGLSKIDGGENIYGFERPDTYLLRNTDGQLDDRFKQTVGESTRRLRDFGNTLGQDADSREQIQLADSYQQLKGMADSGAWEANQRARQFGQIDRDSAQNMANIQNQMAMRGGLGSGAAERMMSNAGRDSLYAKQNAGMNIALQGDERTRGILGQIGQAETGVNQYNASNFADQQRRRMDSLRLAGAVEQSVDSGNIGAMRGDIQNQNLAAHNLYGEDMKAWGAKQTADGQKQAASRSSCFAEGTLVKMEDGTELAIEEIDIGDKVEKGGQVYTILESLAPCYFLYNGIKVTGRHAVVEEGKWIRVEESKDAVFVDEPITVYCLSNVNHRIVIKDYMFADYEEVDNHDEYTPEQCLKKLNGGE